MNIQGILKIDGISDKGEDVISLDWNIIQSAVGGREQGQPAPSQLSIVIESIEKSHLYFNWAMGIAEKKSGSILFSGNEFAKGTPIVIKFTEAVCSGFRFSFNKNNSQGIIFSLQLSVATIEYTDKE